MKINVTKHHVNPSVHRISDLVNSLANRHTGTASTVDVEVVRDVYTYDEDLCG